MQPKLKIAALMVFVSTLAGCGGGLIDKATPLTQSIVPSPKVDAAFITLANKAIVEMSKPFSPYVGISDKSTQTHHVPFFEDSYAISSLTVLYTKTNDTKYLVAAQTWADKIVAYQSQMTPFGAYFPNYSGLRQPGQTEGDWYVADSSSIAQAIARVASVSDAQHKAKYMASAAAFYNLVDSNYVNADGGVSDGIWGTYTPSWWCSTAIFGAFSFVMYEQTGEEKYLTRGLSAFDWLSTQGIESFAYPSFEDDSPPVVFYVGELYVRALPHVAGTLRESTGTMQLQFFKEWLKANQKSRNENSPVNYWVRTYMAGMPYIQDAIDDRAAGDKEMVFVQSLLDSNINLSDIEVWELTTWMLWSMSAKA